MYESFKDLTYSTFSSYSFGCHVFFLHLIPFSYGQCTHCFSHRSVERYGGNFFELSYSVVLGLKL